MSFKSEALDSSDCRLCHSTSCANNSHFFASVNVFKFWYKKMQFLLLFSASGHPDFHSQGVGRRRASLLSATKMQYFNGIAPDVILNGFSFKSIWLFIQVK